VLGCKDMSGIKKRRKEKRKPTEANTGRLIKSSSLEKASFIIPYYNYN